MHSNPEDQPTPPPSLAAPPELGKVTGPYRKTLKVEIVPIGLWRPVAVSVAALVILAASAVHLTLIPLDVLVVWKRPAVLSVSSEPAGASVILDGVRLPRTTPTNPTVKRDRFDHLLEVSLEGYRSARAIVRYDRTVSLSALVSLQKDDGLAIELVREQPLTPSTEAGASGAAGGSDASAGSTMDASASEATQELAAPSAD